MGSCTIVELRRTLILEYADQRLDPQAKREEKQVEPSYFFASCGYVFGHDRRATLPWAQEKSKLTITAIRLVKTKPKRPYPNYKPGPNSWSTQGVEVSAPLNICPEFKPSRSLFEAKGVDSFTVGSNHRQGHRWLRGWRSRRWSDRDVPLGNKKTQAAKSRTCI